jgi:hypothetical protein
MRVSATRIERLEMAEGVEEVGTWAFFRRPLIEGADVFRFRLSDLLRRYLRYRSGWMRLCGMDQAIMGCGGGLVV